LQHARVLQPGEADSARPYDFESPELLSDLHRRLLDAGFASFARQFGVQITAQTRLIAKVTFDSFSLVPFGALGERLDGPGGYVFCSIDGIEPRLVYRIPDGEAAVWAARMVGGTLRTTGDDKPLTAIERALIFRMADETLSELVLAFGELIPRITVEGFGYTLPADIVPADELMILASFQLERNGPHTEMAIALPAAPILQAFGHGLAQKPSEAVTEMLQRQVAAAPIEIALKFDDTRVRPSVVLGLAEGDLIPLSHPRHRPLVITADGATIARAAVGANGARLACVVVEYEEAS
jgi:flagellar motor switch protein FliM